MLCTNCARKSESLTLETVLGHQSDAALTGGARADKPLQLLELLVADHGGSLLVVALLDGSVFLLVHSGVLRVGQLLVLTAAFVDGLARQYPGSEAARTRTLRP